MGRITSSPKRSAKIFRRQLPALQTKRLTVRCNSTLCDIEALEDAGLLSRKGVQEEALAAAEVEEE